MVRTSLRTRPVISEVYSLLTQIHLQNPTRNIGAIFRPDLHCGKPIGGTRGPKAHDLLSSSIYLTTPARHQGADLPKMAQCIQGLPDFDDILFTSAYDRVLFYKKRPFRQHACLRNETWQDEDQRRPGSDRWMPSHGYACRSRLHFSPRVDFPAHAQGLSVSNKFRNAGLMSRSFFRCTDANRARW